MRMKNGVRNNVLDINICHNGEALEQFAQSLRDSDIVILKVYILKHLLLLLIFL